MKDILILSMIIGIVMSSCPNGCNGHGRCISGVCVCFGRGEFESGKSYIGNDCSLLKCEEGNPLFASSGEFSESVSFSGVSLRELSSSSSSSDNYSSGGSADNSESYRILESRVSIMKISGDKAIDSSKNVWNISSSDGFFKTLPKLGGIIRCSYTKNDEVKVIENEEVEVLGVSEDKSYGYLKFKEGIKKEKSITCNGIISIRKSMVNYHTNHKIETIKSAQARRQLKAGDGTLEWDNYYGKIFKDLGILKQPKPEPEVQEEPQQTYTNNNFQFVCYTSSNELIEYPATASYTESGEKKVTFTLTVGDNKPALEADKSYCYCLMDANAKETTIEKTELMEMVKKTTENGEDHYYIGKYVKSTPDVEEYDENGYAVITLPNSYAVTQNSVSETIELTSASDFIEDNRVVYVDILKDGKISEKEVKITSPPAILRQLTSVSFTLKSANDNILTQDDIILPYIKMHSSNPTKDTTPTGTVVDDSVKNLYKVYSLSDIMISQLNKNVGGKLQCNYVKDAENTIEEIEIDVKGYKTSKNNHIYYSYILFPSGVTAANIGTMKCNKIQLRRKDFTLYNPLKLIANTEGGSNYVDGKLTWKGYGDILKDVLKSNVKFACYTPESESGDEKLVFYTIATTNPSPLQENKNFEFTITKIDSHPAAGDVCYLSASSSGEEIKELLNSDLGLFIRKPNDNYYFGRYERPKEGNMLIEPDDNGNPIFIFDNSKNKIEKNGEIIINEDELTDDLKRYFEIDKTIYIEVIGDENIPYNHEAKITKPKSERRLLVEDSQTKTLNFIPSTDDKPTGIISTFQAEVKNPSIKAPIDDKNYLYSVTNFFDDLISELPPQLGGILQCKYVEIKKTGNDVNSIPSMGFVDVKGYKMKDDGEIDYSYIQFDRKVEKNKPEPNTEDLPNVGKYYFENIECNDIISIRNDMSLYNPTSASGNIITWTGYESILNDIEFSLTGKSFKFICYNPNESDKNKRIMTEYETTPIAPAGEGDVTATSGDVEFSFNDDSSPSNDNICYLLSDYEGEYINIESSELFEFVRKDKEDGNYYYGKYENVVDENKPEKPIENDDGSQTLVLGTDSFIIKENEEDGDDKDKINIFKLNNPDSPSILYPPSLISDGIKKLLLPGTTIKFVINNKIQYSQIIKIVIRKEMNNKYEILLSKSVSYYYSGGGGSGNERIRLLNNIRLLDVSSLMITFSSSDSIHKPLECSGQGICNRENGKCECYEGYSGSNCERLDCPSNCNGNGRCVSLSELLGNDELLKYNSGYDNNRIYGCLCDKRHRGYDCSLIECPSDEDPEKGSNMKNVDDEKRDCSGRGICNYESGICECFDGFSGEGCQLQISTM